MKQASSNNCKNNGTSSCSLKSCCEAAGAKSAESQLSQWPIQIKLVSPIADYFENANLLVAADCTAYSYANFHNDFMKDRVTIIGCPRLDEGIHTKKLTEIFKLNNLSSITVVRMEMPCCGIDNEVKKALQNCGKQIPLQISTISMDGKLLGCEKGTV